VNDFSAVKEQQAEYHQADQDGSTCHWTLCLFLGLTLAGLENRLLRAEAVTGKCFVLTFSKAHNTTLADMSPAQIVPVVEAWTKLYAAHLSPTSPLAKVAPATTLPPMGANENIFHLNAQYRYMQIFENKGAAMGCSNPHPHGQVWTTTGMPEEPGLELVQLQKYRREQGGANLLEDYATLEAAKQERIVFENESFLALCPWWGVWPFETMIVSRQHRRALVDFNEKERKDLAEAIAEVTRRYDNLFETHFPYSMLHPDRCISYSDNSLLGMGLHQAPLEGTDEEIEASHFHIHFYPPLLRSATVRKFLVGYELMAEPQRDITPEQAATRLRNCGGELYRKQLA
jgi:UDPglucose--hexose-1-phosphate uridylyltransferase